MSARGKAAKTVTATIKLLIPAAGAKPAPPVGPALGQAGLNIMSFCKDFNAKTSEINVSCQWFDCSKGSAHRLVCMHGAAGSGKQLTASATALMCWENTSITAAALEILQCHQSPSGCADALNGVALHDLCTCDVLWLSSRPWSLCLTQQPYDPAHLSSHCAVNNA